MHWFPAILLMAGVLILSSVSRAEEGKSIATHTVAVNVPLQKWQERRLEFAKIVQGVRNKEREAVKKFDALLSEYEKAPWSITPMEYMDLLAVFYFPNEGIEKCLPVIVSSAVLGWYDALRFGSESGRSEIATNEKFFSKYMTLSSKEARDNMVKFLLDDPEKAREQIELGLDIAEKYKDTESYDRHWPSAYGLERIICAQRGPCEEIKPLPRDQWDAAWAEAKQRVTAYYIIKKPNDPAAQPQPGK